MRMTLLFTVAGAAVLYVGGHPLISYIQGRGNMLIYNGAPADLNEVSSDLPLLIQEQAVIRDKSEGRITDLDARLGTIECERISLSAPLYDNDSEADLLKGAGHYPGSGLPGGGMPVLISGHDTTFFAPLEHIAVGDIIKVSTEDKDYYYNIVEAKVAGKTDSTAYDLKRKKEQLILYTCYPFGQILGERDERFFVYGDPITMDDKYIKSEGLK